MPQQYKQGRQPDNQPGREKDHAKIPSRKITSRRTILAILAAVPFAIAWELFGNGRLSDAADSAAASSDAIGKVEIVNDVPEKAIVEAVNELRRLSR